ncbi:hypothetical protein I6A84_34310 [Frankia sp. CNm7]|uniref:Uncharacterized protein n=1 Tax=Frankia nepalensis TaxID=1836974 RepID=A0A937RFT0_9ACTN|nr:hypothetical protein [Frankia nepalensis]MBL7501638.1 hypothetical protein [Frankia nepalensis]MBL7513378.1 hypothetical protein [Frankia nepalensis]MBL7523021.1 hypothetical protein [Frankia nepalensis]MBL7628069.1 hypothetical protein [Frankia nepalensis]
MTGVLTVMFSDLQRPAVRILFGDLDPATSEDLTTFFVGGSGPLINDWLVDGIKPLDPEDLANSLLDVFSVLAGGHQRQPEAVCHPALHTSATDPRRRLLRRRGWCGA